jgi:hypothetical protein
VEKAKPFSLICRKNTLFYICTREEFRSNLQKTEFAGSFSTEKRRIYRIFAVPLPPNSGAGA